MFFFWEDWTRTWDVQSVVGRTRGGALGFTIMIPRVPCKQSNILTKTVSYDFPEKTVRPEYLTRFIFLHRESVWKFYCLEFSFSFFGSEDCSDKLPDKAEHSRDLSVFLYMQYQFCLNRSSYLSVVGPCAVYYQYNNIPPCLHRHFYWLL